MNAAENKNVLHSGLLKYIVNNNIIIILAFKKHLKLIYLYILITNATTKHARRRQTINQCPWASQDRSLGQLPAPY